MFLIPWIIALGDAFDPAKCHALIVGVLEWKDPRFASFSKEERQDALFAKTLEGRGVPSGQITLLLDEQATLANIEEQLARVGGEAGAGSTLLFYYAGHGTRADGGFCFANYDMTGAAGDFDATRACMVEWRGTWYPALALRVEEPDWWIHYVGFGTRWDERVGADRIRFPAR
jgi:hypothetical protein